MPDSPAARTVGGVSEHSTGMSLQDQYDDAMFDYSTGAFDSALAKFNVILDAEPAHFDARLAEKPGHRFSRTV